MILIYCSLFAAAVVGAAATISPRVSRWNPLPIALIQLALVTVAIVLSIGATPNPQQSYLLATATVAAATFGGPVVVAGLRLATRDGLAPSMGWLPGAAWIGATERFAITVALLLNLVEVAAVIVAVKALGQYSVTTGAPANANEANSVAASRVLGTLVSVAWAILAIVPRHIVAGHFA